MRKLLTIVAVSLVPIGMWTAGCRQDNNRQAAFPKTSDVKGLAKADVRADKNKPPRIDPAPIDREILGYPESPAMARATAVKDRSKQMAKPKASDDLFSLPDSGMASASYDPRPADIGPVPAPAGREFWSRPSAAPASVRSGPVPSDVSAMAPAAPEPSFAGPPVQFMPPPSSQQKTGGSMPFSVEDVPGVFMEGSPISTRGSPPASRKSLESAFPGGDALGAPPPLNKREFATVAENAPEPAAKGPVKLDLTGILGSRASTSAAKSESFDFMPLPSSSVSTTSALASAVSPAIVVQSLPGDYEPLPEPIPLAEYQAMLARTNPQPISSSLSSMQSKRTLAQRRQGELPSASPTALMMKMDPVVKPMPSSALSVSSDSGFIPAPPKIESRKKASVDKVPAPAKKIQEAPAVTPADMKKALAPLPDISGSAPKEKKTEPLAVRPPETPLTLPPPLSTMTPDLAGAKSALGNVSRMAGSEAEAAGALTGRNTFKADPPEMKASLDLELPEPKKAPPARKKTADKKIAAKKSPAPAPLGLSSEIGDLTKSEKKVQPLEPLAVPELTPMSPVWVEEPPRAPALPIPELPEEAAPEKLKKESEPQKKKDSGKPSPVPAVKAEPPKRIKLQPVRRHRDKEISQIDSAMEVPPMKF